MAAALLESVDVVVVGAGISGLSAAYELMKKRPETRLVVLEAKGRPHQKIFSELTVMWLDLRG